jgi:hypothetical protein
LGNLPAYEKQKETGMARNCEPGTRFGSNLNYSILKLDPHSNKFRRKSPESQISPGLANFAPYLQNTQKPRCTFVEEMRNSTVFPANEITRCQSLPATVSVPFRSLGRNLERMNIIKIWWMAQILVDDFSLKYPEIRGNYKFLAILLVFPVSQSRLISGDLL